MPSKVIDDGGGGGGGGGGSVGLDKQYYDSLSELEQKVCEIARDHLKSSFDLVRSSGFLAWRNSHDKK